ncbi:MAG: hypothetical protein IT289_10540 [Oligoflexia bacterium]|nr:hypothetical protein [Oligoflexia bacterium]
MIFKIQSALALLFVMGSQLAFGSIGSRATVCEITYVNEKLNSHLFEEGLGVCGDENADSDSVNVSFHYNTRSVPSISLGQMSFVDGENAAITVSPQDNQYEGGYAIAPYDDSYVLRVKLYKNNAGVVWFEKNSKTQQLIGFNCDRRCPPKY